ncbi:MAG TPA: hypothetical protein O0X69_04140 [Methanocorpusculum sp.]|nr:hypothetical protein [Methanocorpusculum sp.]
MKNLHYDKKYYYLSAINANSEKTNAIIPKMDIIQQITPTTPISYFSMHDPHATREHTSQTNVPKGNTKVF